MLSKDNHYGKQIANTPHAPRYALRRLKVGLVSVALGTVFFFTPQALVDTTSGVDTSTDPSTLTTINTSENHTTNALSSANTANKVSLTNTTPKNTVQTSSTSNNTETVTYIYTPTTTSGTENNTANTQSSNTNAIKNNIATDTTIKANNSKV